MLPVRRVVPLTGGMVTLHAWPATVAEGHLHDLLAFTQTLGALREDWQELAYDDVEPAVWGMFWRLVQASLRGQALPRPVSWADRVELVGAMWELNDLEAAEGKLTALLQRAEQRRLRVTAQLLQLLEQGQKTTP
ncbi:hypothetical protein GO986_09035 [Deinococcus sp. HMF7620]|uniref:Uncharacterized protein n=1 Tax=Deinococcus arboris TaxID=2682977 RepID=A0A7C9HYD5_9DEIO|nr:hypothetical protein [Deinococcus arboris]MVN86908.1 hypothetical protein [Deinococcus arboris]